MIVGTGIDVVEVDRIRKELEKSSERFTRMLFTQGEIDYCLQGSNVNVQSQRFGGRFAAKEAFFKAIGTGLRDGLSWKDVEVVNDEMGRPYLVLANRAQEMIEAEGISNVQVSISHGRNVATSVVILEK